MSKKASGPTDKERLRVVTGMLHLLACRFVHDKEASSDVGAMLHSLADYADGSPHLADMQRLIGRRFKVIELRIRGG